MSRVQTQAPQATTKTIDPEAKLLNDVLEKTIESVDKAATRFSSEINQDGIGQLLRAAKKGAAIKRLRAMLSGELLDLLRSLMNSPMGFLTDKDPKRKSKEGTATAPYDDDVIRDCAIEALLNGVLWDGNEFNIIAGKCYITQNGFWRKVREIPGITDIDVVPGVPSLHNGSMVCRVRATWKLWGIESSLIGADGQPGRVFPIKNDSSSTPDNLTGKALRKAYKAIFEKATGSILSAEAGEVDESSPQTVAPAAQMPTKGGNLKNGTHKAEPAAPAPEPTTEPAHEAAAEQGPVEGEIPNDEAPLPIAKPDAFALGELRALCKAKGSPDDTLCKVLGVAKFEDLDSMQVEEQIKDLRDMPDVTAAPKAMSLEAKIALVKQECRDTMTPELGVIAQFKGVTSLGKLTSEQADEALAFLAKKRGSKQGK